MNLIKLTDQELASQKVGEVVTLTAVMAVMVAAVMVVVIYRLLKSNKGTATIPGGWKFTWN